MGRIFTALYSSVAYVLFLGTFVHAIGFVENIVVRKTIDSGAFPAQWDPKLGIHVT